MLDFEKYKAGRRTLTAKYKKKKWTEVGIIVLCALVLIIAAAFIPNIAIKLVLIGVVALIAIIFARIRWVTVEHTLQEQLKQYESEEPEFHANFNENK